MSSVDAQKTTFNNWAKNIYDRLSNSVTKLVKMLIPGHTSNQSQGDSSTNAEKSIRSGDYFDYVTPEELDLHKKYLNEVIELVKKESLKLATKQASPTNVSDNKITINLWMEDSKSYSVLKKMISGNKIELENDNDGPSIRIVFRAYNWHFPMLRTAALRIFNPSLPNESHDAYDLTSGQLKWGAGSLDWDDITNNLIVYQSSKKVIEDYINGDEIEYYLPKSVRDKASRVLGKPYERAAKAKRKYTESANIFPEHEIFKQIDIIFCDSDGLRLDMLAEKEKQLNKIGKRKNLSFFFCEECSEYFTRSGIPSWPTNIPSKKRKNPNSEYSPQILPKNFTDLVDGVKCRKCDSSPFIMRNRIYTKTRHIQEWFNWNYFSIEKNVEVLEKKIFNHCLLMEGNFESHIVDPPSALDEQHYSNWQITPTYCVQEMYRTDLPESHVHDNNCIISGTEMMKPIFSLRDNWNASNFQFIIEKMNTIDSIAFSVNPEEYSKISFHPKEKCQFNWQILGLAFYEGKEQNVAPLEPCPECDIRDWKRDRTKDGWVCKQPDCGVTNPGRDLIPHSKLRDINQPIKIKHIMLGNE